MLPFFLTRFRGLSSSLSSESCCTYSPGLIRCSLLSKCDGFLTERLGLPFDFESETRYRFLAG